jgi:hypothetical protein
MTNTYDSADFPGIEVEIQSSEEDLTPSFETEYVHIDDFDPDSLTKSSPMVYTFSSMDRLDELQSVTSEAQEQYVYAQGVVFPDWMEGHVEDIPNEVLDAACWLGKMVEDEVQPEDLVEIATYLGSEENN